MEAGNPAKRRWLPGTNEVTYLQLNPEGSAHLTELMRLADRDGAEPRAIPLEERRRFWDYEVARDGKSFAYPVDMPSRMTIWRVDLPAATTRTH